MQLRTQFSIFLVNKPGVLASVIGALAKAHVNIVALTLTDYMEHGVLRIVCEDEAAARVVLGKAHDRWTETEVLSLELANQPGAFAAVAQNLAEEKVNISYAYCTGGAPGGHTTAVFKVADMAKGQKVLSALGLHKSEKRGAQVKAPPTRR
jgi:hypothetical protein